MIAGREDEQRHEEKIEALMKTERGQKSLEGAKGTQTFRLSHARTRSTNTHKCARSTIRTPLSAFPETP